jgi:hypothetical protein
VTYIVAFGAWMLDRLWGEEASDRRYAQAWRKGKRVRWSPFKPGS